METTMMGHGLMIERKEMALISTKPLMKNIQEILKTEKGSIQNSDFFITILTK